MLMTEVPLSLDVLGLKPVGSWSAPYVSLPPSLTLALTGAAFLPGLVLVLLVLPLEQAAAPASVVTSRTGSNFLVRCALMALPSRASNGSVAGT